MPALHPDLLSAVRRLRSLALILLFGAAQARAEEAPELRIREDADGLHLVWPVEASGFQLESASDPITHAWLPAPEPVTRIGDDHTAGPLPADAARFYRLRQSVPAGQRIPTLTRFHLDASSIPPDGLTFIRFRFSDPDADIATLVVSRRRWTGDVVDRIPIELVGGVGAVGDIQQPLRADQLELGLNSICLWLEDAGGRISSRECFDVLVSGAATGIAPAIQTPEPSPQLVRLPQAPNRVQRDATFHWSDPDADVERVRVRVIRPDGNETAFEHPAQGLGLTGTSGLAAVPVLRLSPTDPAGDYRIEVALVDSGGRVSNVLSTTVTASPDSGEVALSATEAVVLHPGDPDQRRVRIIGTGFNAALPAQNEVQLAGQSLVVLNATATQIEATLPHDAQPGRVRVANNHGSAWTPETIAGLPVELAVEPANALLSVGDIQPLSVTLNHRPTHQVLWLVNGIPGGNTQVGTLSSDGLFTAPANIPPSGSVTISARWTNDPSVRADATIRVGQPPPIVDRGIVRAAKGGEVTTPDGRASVLLPPGALDSDSTVSLEIIDGPATPTPPPGTRLLAAFRLGVDPLQGSGTGQRRASPHGNFPRAVAVKVPLAIGLPPGNLPDIGPVEVRVDGLAVELPPPTVNEDGSSLNLTVPVYGSFVIVLPVLQFPAPPPVLTSLSGGGARPTQFEEGRSSPVLLTGQELTDDLSVEIHRQEIIAGGGTNWITTRDVTPGTLQIIRSPGTTAGLTLQVHTIRDLRAGQLRVYRLTLRRPDGAATSLPFSVSGLDELFLAPGEHLVWTDSTTRRFSEVEIPTGASVRVAGPRRVPDGRGGETLEGGILRWESTGPIQIHGLLDGSGANGHPAVGSGGGPRGGLGASLAGDGGQGRQDGECEGIFSPWFTPEGYLIYGPYDRFCLNRLELAIGDTAGDRSPEAASGLNFYRGFGHGGHPGRNGSLLEDIGVVLTVVARAFGSLFNGINCVTTGAGCVFFAENAGGTAAAVDDLIEHFNSDQGRGQPGHEGESSVLSRGLRGHSGGGGGGGGMYDYIFGDDLGGGGGGGGEGGRSIVLASSGNISVGGFITTSGGRGGDASPDRDFVPGPGRYPSSSRFSGGAGGAGSAGDLLVASLGRTVIPPMLMESLGGLPGISGVDVPLEDSQGHILRWVKIADPRTRAAANGQQSVRGAPRPDSAERVLTRRVLAFNGSGIAQPVTWIIRSQGNAVRRVTISPGQRTQALLFDGFNILHDERDETASDVLHHRVLVLPDGPAAGPDRDGDGIGDNDELELGTNPASFDTDGDGVTDLDELQSCRNPRVAEPAGQERDRDCDGWPDAAETALGTSPEDPRSSPRVHAVAGLGRIQATRSDMPVPRGIYRSGAPTFTSDPTRVDVARPAFKEAGAAIPNTTVALPPQLEVIIGGK
jgi:hypothetical protein